MKRVLILGIFTIASLAVAGALVFQSISRSGSSAIEQWIGSQLQTIANSYLNPQLRFTDLDYTYPLTVSLRDFSLRAEDPANPGQPIDIIAATSATLTLAEVPKRDTPIVIKQIVLEKPLISAVAVEAGSKKFIGFSDLLKVKPTTQPVAAAPSTRPALSDVFEMRLIKINGGRIVYNPRIAGTEPMELDQINTELNIEPTDTGWYRLDTAISRKPVFDLTVAGDLNLDTFTVRGMNLKLAAELTQDKLNHLPPQLQKILKQYEISGNLLATLGGDMPITTPQNGALKTHVTLREAHVRLGEYHIPVKSLELAGEMKDQRVDVSTFKIDALRGTVDLRGAMVLNERMDSEVNLRLQGLQLQELLLSRKEGEPLPLAGQFDGMAEAKAPLREVLAHARSATPASASAMPAKWGTGSVELRDGQLMNVRMFKGLGEALGATLKIVSIGQLSEVPRDRAKLKFTMESGHAKIEDIQYVGGFFAARGEGKIELNGTMDLNIRAGPVERMQAMLGDRIGGAIATVTDSVISYRVTGKLGESKVETVIGGGAIGRAGQGVQNGAQGVGEGIQRIGEGIGNILRPSNEPR